MLCLAALGASAGALAGERCAEIDDPGERLACYDAAAQSGDGGRSESAPDATLGESEASLSARIETVAVTSAGRHRFRLDNGQTWEQAGRRAMSLEAGDEVVIKSGFLGSHHMRERDGSSRSVKVRPLEPQREGH